MWAFFFFLFLKMNVSKIFWISIIIFRVYHVCSQFVSHTPNVTGRNPLEVTKIVFKCFESRVSWGCRNHYRLIPLRLTLKKKIKIGFEINYEVCFICFMMIAYYIRRSRTKYCTSNRGNLVSFIVLVANLISCIICYEIYPSHPYNQIIHDVTLSI